MGKKKKSGGQTAKPLSPEAYIRNKARQLPVHKCYKSVNSFEDREMCIIVVRKHPQGTYTLGAYMIDKWCFGVKDSLWRFNIDEIEMNDFLSMFKERLDSLDEIDYVEAHNWVYGAVAFADEACEGRIDEVRKSIRNPWPVYPLPTTNPCDIRDTMRHRFPRK